MGIDGFAQPNAERATWGGRLRLGRLGALAVGIAWLAVWFCGLADRALGEPDEGRYAEVAREMLVSHDWITPQLNGFNFFDKPPLHYWATASAYMAFGVNPWSARLWCALTGLLAMAAMGWAGARLFGREAGGYAMAILGSSLLFAMGSHINTLDMGVAAFLTVGIACFLVAQFDPTAAPYRVWLNLLMWFALALAVLSKGLIGVVLPGMALVVYMVWQRDWSVLRRLSLLTGSVVLLVTCAPWFIVICHRHPDFFDYFFIKEHFTRFLTTVDRRDKPWWFFLPVVILGLFPWAVFLPWNRSDWRRIDASEPAQRFLLVWVGVVFAFFSASHSKLPLYILPVFPTAALLLAHLITVMPHDVLKRRLWILSALTMMCACSALIVAASKHIHSSDDVLRHALRGVFWPLAFIALVAAVGASLLHENHRRLSIYVLALATLAGWQLTLRSFLQYTDMSSAQPVASLIEPELGPQTKVYLVQHYLRGLPFYLGRLVIVVDHQDDDMTPELASRPEGYIPDMATFEATWRASNDAVALIPDRELAQLHADNMPFRVVGHVQQSTVIARSGSIPNPVLPTG